MITREDFERVLREKERLLSEERQQRSALLARKREATEKLFKDNFWLILEGGLKHGVTTSRPFDEDASKNLYNVKFDIMLPEMVYNNHTSRSLEKIAKDLVEGLGWKKILIQLNVAVVRFAHVDEIFISAWRAEFGNDDSVGRYEISVWLR